MSYIIFFLLSILLYMNTDTDVSVTETSEYVNNSIFNNLSPAKIYSHNDKKLLVKRIEDVNNKKCYIKIFKTIYNNEMNYSTNDNGIFFNLTSLPDNIIKKIDAVVRYYESKKILSQKINVT